MRKGSTRGMQKKKGKEKNELKQVVIGIIKRKCYKGIPYSHCTDDQGIR